ncbi:MAG TPA: PIG-L family deacetylase [Spirochaetia bacterium]|nr:PIG-L family deacetylase [Spirochaetia bacterium]
MATTVLAISAHPDDIEWTMAGTMLLLGRLGCTLHYMTIANGCYGTQIHSKEEIARIRRAEAMASARAMGAEFHESIVDDFEIFHVPEQIRKVAAVVRRVAPDIILTHPLEDYMEDHMNGARLACSAAFIRASANYLTDPPVDAVSNDVCIYHTLPHGLLDRMRNPVHAERYVDIGSVIEEKRRLISLHKSQEAWLAQTQGTKSLADSMTEDSRRIGELTLQFTYAEGWNRHLHVGYSSAEIDPLGSLLEGYLSP